MANVADRPPQSFTSDTLAAIDELQKLAAETSVTASQLKDRLLGPVPTTNETNTKLANVPSGAMAEIIDRLGQLRGVLQLIYSSVHTLNSHI
jgi:hypothetical protein